MRQQPGDHSRLRRTIYAGCVALGVLALSARAHFEGRTPWQDAVAGGALTALAAAALYWLGCALLGRVLGASHPLFAVARQMVLEGIRRRTALALACANFALIALLLGIMDPSGTVEFRAKNFLTYAMAATLVTTTALIILHSSASLSSDFEERQVYAIFTKPVARAHYLAGKWLGLVAVCALQLACAGVAIVLGVAVLLANPALDAGEARAVRDALVVVHRVLLPETAVSLEAKITQDLPAALMKAPERFAGLSPTAQRDLLRSLLLVSWRNVPPGEERHYLFRGVGRDGITLRFKPQNFGAALGQKIELHLELNGRPQRFFAAINEVNLLPIAPEWFDGSDQLLVRMRNPVPAVDSGTLRSAITLQGRSGIELLEPSGGLAGNLARVLCVYWVQLAFLAACGVFGGCFLNFSVTCLLLIVIAGAANSSHYLLSVAAEAPHARATAHSHGPNDAHDHDAHAPGLGERVVGALESFGLGVARVLQRYGSLAPAELVVDGRALEWRELGEYALWVGGLWTGCVAAAALALFGRRELARVQV
ncbi:MAG: ABC transporter permease [Planctomycetota bacterium]